MFSSKTKKTTKINIEQMNIFHVQNKKDKIVTKEGQNNIIKLMEICNKEV